MSRLSDMNLDNIASIQAKPVSKVALVNFCSDDKYMQMMPFKFDGEAVGGNIVAMARKYDYESGADAGFRGYGEEYSDGTATPKAVPIILKPLGKQFSEDVAVKRAMGGNNGYDQWLEDQVRVGTAYTKAKMLRAFISGNSTANAKETDGIYATIFKNNPDNENIEYLDATSGLTDTVCRDFEEAVNNAIAKMNCEPNVLITTRNGAALAKTVNARRNLGTEVLEVGGAKYSQFMGLHIIPAADADFPASRAGLGIPFIVARFDDADEHGIYSSIPADGTIIEITDPADGAGTQVKNGAVEFVGAPVFVNDYAAACVYVHRTTNIGELTATAAAGATSGKTKVTITESLIKTTNKFMVKSGSSVDLPDSTSNLSGYVDFTNGSDVTATQGHDIVVVEVTADKKPIRADKVTAL